MSFIFGDSIRFDFDIDNTPKQKKLITKEKIMRIRERKEKRIKGEIEELLIELNNNVIDTDKIYDDYLENTDEQYELLNEELYIMNREEEIMGLAKQINLDLIIDYRRELVPIEKRKKIIHNFEIISRKDDLLPIQKLDRAESEIIELLNGLPRRKKIIVFAIILSLFGFFSFISLTAGVDLLHSSDRKKYYNKSTVNEVERLER